MSDSEPRASHPPPVEEQLGERLVERGLVTESEFEHALALQRQAGLPLGRALISLNYLSDNELARELAEQSGLPYFDLRAEAPDPGAARLLTWEQASAWRMLPLYAAENGVYVACAGRPADDTWRGAQEVTGCRVHPVIAADSALDEALEQLYRSEFVDAAASHLLSTAPEDSASRVLSVGQRRFLLGLLAIVGLGMVVSPMLTAIVGIALATVFYVTFFFYKLYLSYLGAAHSGTVETTAADVAALTDAELPVYTILIPVYREAEVLPVLVDAVGRLDYPTAKLDVRILLEEDDAETIAVAERARLPNHFKLVIVPHGRPKGKPKACNYGLLQARGEYVVIYDAEDVPEPDQLKKAVVAFREADPRLACVQARLNYFNRDQNLLTRWFTAEYSMWFDLFLPGLDACDAPIPLGGTSNHFKMACLREIGAWDPHNVTEDADLGIRLYKAGWKTAIIDSTTYEEANSELYNWIRQRSRWVKGYIQTYLVHMRHPVALWRALGPQGFLSFQFMIGGTFLTLLVNPLFWALTILWFVAGWQTIKSLFPAPVYYAGLVAFLFGNFTFTYLNVIGCIQRGYFHIVKYAITIPLYWVLMSAAAWKGFLQLFYAPSYWEKTRHGLYQGRVTADGLEASGVPDGRGVAVAAGAEA